MAAVLVLLASGLAACGDDDSDAGPPEPRPTPTPTASQASESTPAADPTDGVGPRRGALRYADILVFSKDTLTDDMVDRIRGLDGVRSVERLSMAQVSIENRAINLAAVDPATYRNYTPAESAEFQEEWDRVAAGQSGAGARPEEAGAEQAGLAPPGQRPRRADGGHRRRTPRRSRRSTRSSTPTWARRWA